MGCPSSHNRTLFLLVSFKISVVDFVCTLPWPETFLDENSRRTLFLWVTTGIIILLVLLYDTKPIVMVASWSIFALIISFMILLGYGLVTYKLTWKQSFLFPLSAASFFSSIGIPSYSLGYNFSFLSFYVSFHHLFLYRKELTRVKRRKQKV